MPMRNRNFLVALVLALPVTMGRSNDGQLVLKSQVACADGTCITAANVICSGMTHKRALN